eukprot:g1872.t1
MRHLYILLTLLKLVTAQDEPVCGPVPVYAHSSSTCKKVEGIDACDIVCDPGFASDGTGNKNVEMSKMQIKCNEKLMLWMGPIGFKCEESRCTNEPNVMEANTDCGDGEYNGGDRTCVVTCHEGFTNEKNGGNSAKVTCKTDIGWNTRDVILCKGNSGIGHAVLTGFVIAAFVGVIFVGLTQSSKFEVFRNKSSYGTGRSEPNAHLNRGIISSDSERGHGVAFGNTVRRSSETETRNPLRRDTSGRTDAEYNIHRDEHGKHPFGE